MKTLARKWLRHGVPAIAVLLAGLATSSLRAEGPVKSTVSGQGTSELKRQPEVLRVHVELLAKARTAKDALAKLRERRQTVRTQLEAMGAAPEAIEFGEASIVTEAEAQERYVEMIMRRMNQGQKAAGKAKEAPPVVVACPLKVELRLVAPNPEELLLLAHSLETRIKAADLADLKNLKQATPQDEEIQEQMQAMMGQGEIPIAKRGEPIFLYVSKVSEEDRLRAVREAFKRAELQAGQLARGAGALLGPVCELAENQETATETVEVNQNNFPFWMGMRSGNPARPGNGGEERKVIEAVGPQPSKVFYRVSLTASFELLRRPVTR
jgi:uncharacterized protein YggE